MLAHQQHESIRDLNHVVSECEIHSAYRGSLQTSPSSATQQSEDLVRCVAVVPRNPDVVTTHLHHSLAKTLRPDP